MPKAAPIITSFNAGEFSPLMAGRVDLKYYPNACRRIRNYIITPQGPAIFRGGTRFAAAVKNSAHRTWLSRFEFNVEQAYVLEFGNLYIRFFSEHGVVGAPFEVVTPYPIAALTGADGTFQIRTLQSNDVQYLVHGDYQQQKLTRTGAATFALAALETSGGPFKDVDPDTTVTVVADAATGTATLTASSAIFLAGHVGSLFYLEQKNVDDIEQWEPGKSVSTNDLRRSDGKNYIALNSATTGSVRPTHAIGAKFDGDGGVQWEFLDSGFGWGKITAIGGGGTTATLVVQSRLPDGSVGSGNETTRWAHAAWSDVEGWPDVVTFFDERLFFFRGQDGWASVSGDYENFRRRDEKGLVTVDMAFVFTISSDRGNRIEWAAPANGALLIGTAGDEHALVPITNTEAFGAGNARAVKQTEYGSRHVPIARVGDGVLFVQKAGRKIRDMKMAESVNERWIADDVTILAEHVTRGGIIDQTYQQEPDSVSWYACDGKLLGFTLNREQEVRGWHPHRIGGYSNAAQTDFAIVESIISTPAPDGDRDELWMIVGRYINGSYHRYIEWMEHRHEKGDDPDYDFYVDSGLTVDNLINATLTPSATAVTAGEEATFTASAAVFGGATGRLLHYRYSTTDVRGEVTWHRAVAEITAVSGGNTVATATVRSPWPNTSVIPANGWRLTVTAISGLTHLIGQTVDIVGDGAIYPTQVVDGSGNLPVALDPPAGIVHVGLHYRGILQPMPIEAGAADGTAQGKTTRISRVTIRFLESRGTLYGRDEDVQLDRVLSRGGGDNMDEAPPLFTGDKTVSWPSGYDGPAQITIVQDEPSPSAVICLMPQMHTEDNR
jgi:hypothetical protein